MPPRRGGGRGRKRDVPDVEKEAAETEREVEDTGRSRGTARTLSPSQQRPSKSGKPLSPSPSAFKAASELRETPQFFRKRHRADDAEGDGREEEEERGEDEDEGTDDNHASEGEEARGTPTRRSTFAFSRDSRTLHDPLGGFYDISTMRPLRVRVGVCPLPGCTDATPLSSSSLLLSARKFFALPEEKGGADVVGWAFAASGVAVELPGEGVYNNASVSVTVMLPP